MDEPTHIWTREADERPPHDWPLVFIEDGYYSNLWQDDPIPDDVCDLCRTIRLLERQWRDTHPLDPDMPPTESDRLYLEHLPRLHDTETCEACDLEMLE
jgi:hypothetical protein